MFLGVNYIRPVGAGAVNRGKNGELKSINIGGTSRDRYSAQKEKSSIRDYVKNSGSALLATSDQSRVWGLWIATELTNRKVPQAKAEIWAKETMDNFLAHNLKKAEEKKKKAEEAKAKALKEGKKVKEDKNPLYSETVRLFPEEKQQLLQVIEDLASGTLKSPKDVVFSHQGGAFDTAASGRMRPTSLTGAISVGHATGVGAMSSEEDYFVAKDDFRNEPWYIENPDSSAHIGTSNLSASTMHNYIEINKTELIKNLGGDMAKADEAIDAIIQSVCVHGSRSSSTSGAQTHTYAAYVIVEKMESPRSLGVAFNPPVSSVAEAVERIRSFRENLNSVYCQNIPCKEMFCYPDDTGKIVSGGNIEELKTFAKS